MTKKEYLSLKINFLSTGLLYISLFLYITIFLTFPAIFTNFNMLNIDKIGENINLPLKIFLIIFFACWIIGLITVSDRRKISYIWKHDVKLIRYLEVITGFVYLIATIRKGAYFAIFAVLILALFNLAYTNILTFIRLCQFDLSSIHGIDNINIKADGIYLKGIASYKKNIAKKYPDAKKYLAKVPGKKDIPPYKNLIILRTIHIVSAFIVIFGCFVLPTVFGKYYAMPLIIYIFSIVFFVTLIFQPKCIEYTNAIVSIWKTNILALVFLILTILITGYASIFSVFYFFAILLVPLWTKGMMYITAMIKLNQFDLEKLNRAKHIPFSEKEWQQAIIHEYPEAEQYLRTY